MSNSSRAFKHLSPDELKWVDATLFRNYHLDPEFAELPLARVCRKWSSMGRNYLSPFALAGITIIKHSLTDFLPLSFTVVRFAIASAALFGFMAVRREPFAIEPRDILKVVALGLTGITIYNLLFMKGLQLTTASHSALFISLLPVFAAGLQTIRGRERMRLPLALGLLLATTGAYCIILSTHGEIRFGMETVTGDLLTIGASVLWAFYTVLAAPLLERYPRVTLTAWSVASGTATAGTGRRR